MVLCKECKRCIEIYENVCICEIDWFTTDITDNMPCDGYVPLDADNSERDVQ